MKKYIIVTVSVVAGLLLGVYYQPLISGDNIYGQVKKFDYVLNTAIKNYVEDVDSYELAEAAIKGMLNELDVHSVYISAERQKEVDEEFKGSFEGIGVEYQIINDTIVIISPIPGGPCESLGIMAGDKIVKINDSTAVGLSRTEIPKRLKGPKGTTVDIDIFRDGESELIHYTITRDVIPKLSVDASFMLDDSDIGVVKINRFASKTTDELVSALSTLSKEGMKKLILDLRGNPGGYLNQAFLMADQFLPMGDTIVYTKGRIENSFDTYMSTGGELYENIPLIVLVNSGSASASEIVSGAIQDLDRGLIVGETSYGKGLVQRAYKYGDGSGFRITIAKYYTPSGRCIQRPYKDKEKYRNLVGRFKLEEGSYIYNAYDKIREQIAESNKDKSADEEIHLDSIPIFITKHGRTVLGAGGITPDYIVKSDTITDLGVEIRRKNMFFHYAIDYLKRNGDEIRQKYLNNFGAFSSEFMVSDQMMEEFIKLAAEKGVEWNDEDYQTDKASFKIIIKAYLARSIWDRSKMIAVMQSIDRPLQKASELFPELDKLTSKN